MTKPSVTEYLDSNYTPEAALGKLTPRQLDVLKCAAFGYSRIQTMQILGNVTIDTVKQHRLRAVEKLGARNLDNAIYIACKAGIL